MPATPPNRPDLPKRFYKAVSTSAQDGGWRIELDGRPVKTPAKAALVLPSEALAALVASDVRLTRDSAVADEGTLAEAAALARLARRL